MSENEDNENKGVITAKIIVKGQDEIDKLKKELEEERIEKEDLASKLETIAEVQFNKALEKAKSEGTPSGISTIEELEEWKEKQEKQKSHNSALSPELGSGGSGKAPLSGEPSGSLSTVKEYPDVASMMEDLRERSHSENKEVAKEAQEIIKKLNEKLKGDHNFSFEVDFQKIIEDKAKKDAELRKRGAKTVNWREL